MTSRAPLGNVPLAVIDPALGRTGAHNVGFADMLLAGPPGPVGFWSASAMPPSQQSALTARGAAVSLVFRRDFYELFHKPGGVAANWEWIDDQCADYLRALREVLAHWPAGPVQVLHHTLSWEHATALSLAIGLLGVAGSRLRHLVLLMYSPGVAADGTWLDPGRRLDFRLAFSALERFPNVALHASCSDHARAYAALLGRPLPLPVHPCFLGDWSAAQPAIERDAGRVLAYVGEAKEEKGFLELPRRLARMAADDRSPDARFVVHCVAARTDAARSVMAEVRALSATDPRILVEEGYWTDEELHLAFARASLACLDYDGDAYANKTSGLLWLAAWHGLPVRVPERSWLAREGARLGLALLPSRAAADPRRAQRVRGSMDEDYRRKLFTPFRDWLIAQAGPTDPGSPAARAKEGTDRASPEAIAAIHAAVRSSAARARLPASPCGPGADIVLFWKQNDSTLYGRRIDMVAGYLARRGDVRRVVVVDAPISDMRLAALAEGDRLDQARWVHDRALAKLRGDHDAAGIVHDVFVYDGSRFGPGAHEAAFPAFTDAYGDHLERLLGRAGIDATRAVFWVYPRDFCMPALLERFAPRKVVVDMVDDDRAWPGVSLERKQRLGRNYAALLEAADLALANCAPVQAGLRELREDIVLVPNGCDDGHARMRPAGTPPDTGAVIGYVGNLEAKIDIPLLEKIAERFPRHRLVLVGSAHANPAARALSRYPNVEMPGVVPYDRLGDWLSRFDVGVIPHLDMEMTRRMNPLKTHVYLAWGVPVVSTAVANVESDGELVRIAVSHEAFLHQLAQVLGQPRPEAARFREHVAANSWASRLGDAVDSLSLSGLDGR